MDPEDNSPQMIEHLQPSFVVILLRIAAVLLFMDTLLAVIIAGFFLLNNIHDWHNSYIFLLLFLNGIKFLIVVAAITQMFFQWAGRNYYLSGHHLIEKLGLINITETTYELSQVKSVIVRQSWIARRLNYGTINLTLAGSNAKHPIVIRDINNPAKYKQYFDKHLQVQGWVR